MSTINKYSNYHYLLYKKPSFKIDLSLKIQIYIFNMQSEMHYVLNYLFELYGLNLF